MIEKSLEMANKAIELLQDKKAFDIRLIEIADITSIADYFIIASGSSTTQVQAMSNELEEKMKDFGYIKKGKEGLRGGRWVLLDYGDIVIHNFHEEERKVYSLEKIWADGKTTIIENH